MLIISILLMYISYKYATLQLFNLINMPIFAL